MHESSLIGSLMIKIEEIARDAGAERVTRVTVRIGALAGISPDHFREHWQREALDTVAQDARLDVELMRNEWDPLAMEVVLESVEIEPAVAGGPS